VAKKRLKALVRKLKKMPKSQPKRPVKRTPARSVEAGASGASLTKSAASDSGATPATSSA
jgi:hypothetical protein